MSTKKNFTPEEAKAWIETREWANGWDCNPDASVNAVAFAEQYHANKELWDKMFTFLRDHDLHTLPKGKHEVVPGRLWFNMLEYTPKSPAETRSETHNKFIDLQYTFEGCEMMGHPKGGKPNMEYDPVKDRTFFDLEGDTDYVPATPDRFFLYFPGELHQPSVILEGEATPSRKIVGKIEYAE